MKDQSDQLPPHFFRRQLVILGFILPFGYAIMVFPWLLLAVFYPIGLISSKPLDGLLLSGGILAGIAGFMALGVTAWRRERWIWTILFLLLPLALFIGGVFALHKVEERNFRHSRSIPPEDRIVFFSEKGGWLDTTRFCLVQNAPHHSKGSPEHRPFPPVALALVRRVQESLHLSPSLMPDMTQQTLQWSSGEFTETNMAFLTIYDSKTNRTWYFED